MARIRFSRARYLIPSTRSFAGEPLIDLCEALPFSWIRSPAASASMYSASEAVIVGPEPTRPMATPVMAGTMNRVKLPVSMKRENPFVMSRPGTMFGISDDSMTMRSVRTAPFKKM